MVQCTRNESPQLSRTRRPEQLAFRPNVDILEQDDALVLIADIPGADESQTDVTIDNQVLTIKGRIDDLEFEGYQLAWQEFRTGSFERSFTMPQEIDVERVTAAVNDGVLRIVLPKSKERGVRRIEVQAH